MLNVKTINLAAGGAFFVQNATGGNLAVIDSVGNMDIKGSLTESADPTSSADTNDFVIQSNNGSINFVVTNPEGNLKTRGSVSQSQSALNPTPSSFIIQNKTGSVIAYVNNTGALFLTGALTQNVDFG